MGLSVKMMYLDINKSMALFIYSWFVCVKLCQMLYEPQSSHRDTLNDVDMPV